ncbi:hypothetical protein ASPWEDRAFT_107047 [Aspergillus wentii DTO 134E9]|uniref:Uncharacterized protein n=1 Tax=Aspergillus wentii DTO 134E9 TaxID=1073089 RepID=A0A1L9RNI3_ASPWE|nr:uncharacterized protein ASPWEDRAFT_107047 [Aspergillus wentii DTO 134E9]OJJ36509.1 hypothetical protein ASPWEDRAFT_107047 [Aspergillus wentii DTO 134E9]
MTITVLETPKIKTKRREPLKTIDMAATQAQARPAPSAAPGGTGRGRPRRTSSRLSMNQEKEENTKGDEKKRKADYDEDEGFQFKRITSKKLRQSIEAIPEDPQAEPENPPQSSPKRGRPKKQKAEPVAETKTKASEGAVKRPARGTAKAVIAEQDTQPGSARRSTRKSEDLEAGAEKKRKKGRPAKAKPEERNPEERRPERRPEERRSEERNHQQNGEQRNGFKSPEPQQTAKIALPLADTPVIQRNKEMRGAGKSSKGNRRSSLGMRGRRASSLIDSGASNALPHKEVDTADFYKHIASDGLPEPRRMRQLLTWCGTRAVADKPSGSGSEDASARLAARVIQEELLKDFSMNSELSNWFGREDVTPPAVVVKKPNPKNIQNTDKIKELEEQIQRLQRERHSLNAILRPPSIPQIKPPISKQTETPLGDQPPLQPESSTEPTESHALDTKIDRSLLEPSQQAILATLEPEATKHPSTQQQEDSSGPTESLPSITPSAISSRLSRIATGLAPTLDSLAAGVHEIELYRAMSDAVSSRVLRICAERLEERDARNALRRLAIEGGEDSKEPRRVERRREDLGVILGALSRVERR